MKIHPDRHDDDILILESQMTPTEEEQNMEAWYTDLEIDRLLENPNHTVRNNPKNSVSHPPAQCEEDLKRAMDWVADSMAHIRRPNPNTDERMVKYQQQVLDALF